MGWTLFFMMVVLKIPMAAAGYLVWYAIRAEPQPDEQTGTDKGPRRRKLPPFPRWPRRGGPAGGSGDCQQAPCPEQLPAGRPATVIARSRS